MKKAKCVRNQKTSLDTGDVRSFRDVLLNENAKPEIRALASVMVEKIIKENGFKDEFGIDYNNALNIAACPTGTKSDEAMVNLLTWDKSVVRYSWFVERLLKAEREKESVFFEKVANAIKNTKNNRFGRKSHLDGLRPYIEAFETKVDYNNPETREAVREAYEIEFREAFPDDHPFQAIIVDPVGFYNWLKRQHFID